MIVQGKASNLFSHASCTVEFFRLNNWSCLVHNEVVLTMNTWWLIKIIILLVKWNNEPFTKYLYFFFQEILNFNFTILFLWPEGSRPKMYHHYHHHHHVHEGLCVFPVPWSSKLSCSLHLFFGRPMFLRSFGLYCSACFGILFVTILCTCFSHFLWYCFISFTMFCAAVFFPNTLRTL